MRTKEPIVSRTFVILCSATFFFFLSSSALIPILPRHLQDLGASPSLIGLTNGALWLPAIFLRPFVGRYIDRRGRKLAVLVGFAVSAVACFSYSFAHSVEIIIVIRLFHGVAFATFYPGSSTMMGDIAPESRRAEAFSYFSMFLFAGTAIGPAVGEHFYLTASAYSAFILSGAIAVGGLFLATTLREAPVEISDGAEPGPLLNRAALFPALVLAMVAFSLGGAETFVPLYVDKFGGGDTRVFFTTFAVTIMVLRIFVGRIADRYGRAAVIFPGTAFCGLAMFVLARDANIATIATSAVIFGLGWGFLFPGLFALTVDRVPKNQRGSATGTFTAAFDLTFGGGQVLLGALLEATNFQTIFITGGASAILGGIVFGTFRKKSDAAFPPLEATYPADDAASASS